MRRQLLLPLEKTKFTARTLVEEYFTDSNEFALDTLTAVLDVQRRGASVANVG